ncbi:hypothetical protein ACFLZA_01745 [Candidatus Neomarinimicrobiota bacterium]
MKIIIRLGIIIVLLCLFVIPVQAQSEERAYEQGSVWTISYIETKPGHFDDYLEDLSNVWKKYLDENLKDGKVLSYKILSVSSPRDDEPDLILMIEQKDWAVFDTPDEYWDEVAKKVQGSLDKAQQAGIKREELRTLRGSQTAVELLFK